MDLVFATNNKHKLEEIKNILPSSIKILSLKEIGCVDELPETGNTLEQNATQKARYVFDKYGYDCFADDTGLEVEALHGRPGVYSARYAGPQCNFQDNIQKVLGELNNEDNRKAKFRTVICLIRSQKAEGGNTEIIHKLFQGEVKGEIILEQKGANGFGYDPIFIPQGFSITFAEMETALKNTISHRADAVKKLTDYLMTNDQ
jgi:XTP/dITP diphosphohydrolase